MKLTSAASSVQRLPDTNAKNKERKSKERGKVRADRYVGGLLILLATLPAGMSFPAIKRELRVDNGWGGRMLQVALQQGWVRQSPRRVSRRYTN